MTDPIADMIIRIKNALLVRHESVEVPHSKMKAALAKLLVDSNYLESVEVKDIKPQAVLLLKLRYVGKSPAITDVKRLSKPGRRVYAPAHKIPRALGGYGLTLVSTSRGILTDTQARQQNVGGELLCQVW
jgi:small subunit ribosomal protein S8